MLFSMEILEKDPTSFWTGKNICGACNLYEPFQAAYKYKDRR